MKHFPNRHSLWLAVACLTSTPVWAQTYSSQPALTPKAQYEAETQRATARFKEDQKLCAEEPTSAARMQCKRDAKTEYDRAMAAAKQQLASAPKTVGTTTVPCPDCVLVQSIQQVDKAGEGSAVGMIAGGAAGALLGRQIGGGTGRDLATIAGAAGGAYAGREIEKRMKSHKVWVVNVRYPNGENAQVEFDHDPGFKVGDSVRAINNTLVRP